MSGAPVSQFESRICTFEKNYNDFSRARESMSTIVMADVLIDACGILDNRSAGTARNVESKVLTAQQAPGSGEKGCQMTLPPLDWHSLVDEVSIQPKPLHEFLPLHDDWALLQALVPLHELTPAHLTLVLPAEAAATMPLTAKAAAAAAARKVRLDMTNSSGTRGDDSRFGCKHDFIQRCRKDYLCEEARSVDQPRVKRSGESAASFTPSTVISSGNLQSRARLAARRPAAAAV